MATVSEAIRRLTVEATNRGVTETTEKLRQLGKAQQDVAVTSQQTERATQSMEKRLESIQRRYDADFRAQRDLARVEKDLKAAKDQGLITEARRIELIGLATQRHKDQASAQSLAIAQAQQYAGQAGVLGQVLTRLGPAGVGAAAGLAVLAVGIKQASDAAHKFADDMGKLRDSAQIIGLTTTQLQAINDAGAEFALTEDKISNALQKFAIAMEEARRGQGGFFETAQRIDPVLAKELATTEDLAKAVEVFGQIYDKAGQARARFAREGLGRGGQDVALLLGEISKRGGVDAITREFEKSGDAIDQKMIERVRQLKREIDDMSDDATRNIASIFSVPVLEAQATFVEKWRDLTRIAKEFTISADLRELVRVATLPVTSTISTLIRPQQLLRPAAPGAPASDSFSDRFSFPTSAAVPLPASRPATGGGLSADAQYNIERQRIQLLGEAASATERLRLRTLELNASRDKLSDVDYRRALGIATLETAIQLESRRIGILGESASVDEQVLLKQKEINLARAQGVKITQEESEAILERTRLQAEYAKLPNRLQFERDQLGRSDIDATVASRLRGEGLPIDFGSATAQMIRLNEQLRLAKDLSSEFATGFASDFTNQLRQGVDAWEAFGNAGLNALNRLADRLIEIAAQQLVAKAFGGLAGGFPGANVPGAPSNFAGFNVTGLHSGGIVGRDSTFERYVHPAYFDEAPRFARGGVAGIGPDEVPAILHRDEEVVRRDDPRHRWNGGGSSTEVNIYNESGGETEVQRSQDGNGREIIEVFVGAAKQDMAKGGFDQVMGSRYRNRPGTVRR